MSSFNELFLEELADIYDAEKQLTKALPKMAKAASTPELQEAFENHLEETKRQVTRAEQVFEALGQKAKGKSCKAMKGLIEEGEDIIKQHDKSPLRDAALIAAAQKVEHYEIASYGCLCTWAEILGQDEALDLLKETMDEEEEADQRLTEIAESTVNSEAAGESEEMNVDEEEPAPSSRRGQSR
jgi:ferritin-like metal-binding protein YciE